MTQAKQKDPSRSQPVKNPPHSPLREILNQTVEYYIKRDRKKKTGGLRIWIKSCAIVAWAATSWIALVFFAANWWQALLLGASLGLAVAGIGFNVQHDGGHGAYSRTKLFNRFSALMLDLVGGSSYMWNFKHNIMHHQYTNVDGVDDDLEAWPFLRLAPGQKRLWFHRFQWLYIWPLYVFFPPKWQWWDDFRTLIKGKIGDQRIPRPKGWNLTWLFLGKLLFFTWALIVPLFVHSFWHVLGIYAFVALVLGITLGTVFQLAHCVEEADIQAVPAGGRLPQSWAEHQLATTADFSPRNPILTWYLGGLNYQVEHHLFPRISHVHYKRLAPVVRKVCADAGVPHYTNSNLFKALRSHVRFLRRMGKKETA